MHLTAGNLVLVGALSTWLQPLWVVGLGALAAVGLLVAVYGMLLLFAPKVAAIARVSSKEALSQPLFFVILAIGIFILLIFPFIPYNTFGEDIKMLKAEGLTLIKVLSIFLALWTASVSIAEEIEGRTALTLLSKPVGRRQLIFGKFLGVVGPVAILFVILGTIFLGSVSYKVVYDARENSQPDPTAAECYAEMKQIAPGLALSFLEAVILASVSVAISTRLSWLPNFVICASIYVLGHLVPMLVKSSVGEFPMVPFIAQFFATVLPVLDHFGMEAAISTGQTVPAMYMVWATLYALLYSGVAMFLALLLFEDRDLA
jgi:ABC-type transport system involved in multi-copper enzyme maturation permease subunit